MDPDNWVWGTAAQRSVVLPEGTFSSSKEVAWKRQKEPPHLTYGIIEFDNDDNQPLKNEFGRSRGSKALHWSTTFGCLNLNALTELLIFFLWNCSCKRQVYQARKFCPVGSRRSPYTLYLLLFYGFVLLLFKRKEGYNVYENRADLPPYMNCAKKMLSSQQPLLATIKLLSFSLGKDYVCVRFFALSFLQ